MIILFLSFVFAVLEWTAEFKKNKKAIYWTKPTMMILLIIWVFSFSQIVSFPLMWYIIALIFCLGGDVFLMLPPRFFLPGLISFLVGHIFYIVGFGNFIPESDAFVPALVIISLLVVAFIFVYQKLSQGMQASGKSNMRVPVAIYAVVISIMLYAALMTIFNLTWQPSHAGLVSSGALLFFVSDILNAWTRFVSPFPNDRLYTMITYHLGQIGLAVGATLHFMSW